MHKSHKIQWKSKAETTMLDTAFWHLSDRLMHNFMFTGSGYFEFLLIFTHCLWLKFHIFLKFSSQIRSLSLQVIGGNLLPEAVTWFYTSVLRALQVHGQHEVCNSTLSQLAMLIYENLVRLKAISSAISALYFDLVCLTVIAQSRWLKWCLEMHVLSNLQ